MQVEPLAVQLYRQFAAGWSEAGLAAATGIPLERLRPRLSAGREFLRRRGRISSSAACTGERSARATPRG